MKIVFKGYDEEKRSYLRADVIDDKSDIVRIYDKTKDLVCAIHKNNISHLGHDGIFLRIHFKNSQLKIRETTTYPVSVMNEILDIIYNDKEK